MWEINQTKNLTFSCDQSENSFYRISDLARHRLTYAHHICSMCNESFHQQEELAFHFRIHKSEMPYTCEICEKCFTTEEDLDFHNHTHTTEKTCTCKTCGKEFKAKLILSQHNRTHNSEKSYSADLNQKALHPKIPCPVRDKEFGTRDLSKHISNVHKNIATYY